MEDELAFYDVLQTNGRVVKVLRDQTLRGITRELVGTVRNDATENVRAHLRVLVTRILRKHACPSDRQEEVTRIVPEQAEILSVEWATLTVRARQ